MTQFDVAIVGAGPAGIAAALAAASCGASVLLVDEAPDVGGHLRWSIARQRGSIAEFRDARGVEIALWSAQRLKDAGVHTISGSVAWGLFDGLALGVTGNGSSRQFQTSAVIIATGSTDVVEPFPGWELPGVMTASAALRLMHLDLVLPGRRVAVIGDGALADEVVEALAVVDVTIAVRIPDCTRLSAGGRGQVEWIEYEGQRSDSDCVIMAIGKQPDPELVMQAGADLEFSLHEGCFVPSRSAHMETSIARVYAVGDCGGVVSAEMSFAEGRVAGFAAVGSSGVEQALHQLESLRRQSEHRRADSGSQPSKDGESPVATASLLPERLDDSICVCRCEEIAASSIRQALAEGATTLNDVKRRTRAGMGACQGIYCLRTVSAMLRYEGGVEPATLAPMTPRAPARMISLDSLASIEEG